MKKNQYKLFFFLLIINYLCIAQNVGINSTGANPHPSALLDVDASPNNNTGILIPRIALTSVALAAPVSNPATSLLVYNTASASTSTNAVNPGYYYWDGTKWIRFITTAWDVLGNTGTNANTNFLGTTDAQDLVFRTNNLEKARVTTAGNVGIGTTAPTLKLHLHDPAQNFHAIRLTAGVSQANFWDIIKRGDNYAPNQNNNFALGYNNIEKFTMTPTGEVGIGAATPQARLHVFGPKPAASAGTGVANEGPSQAIIADGATGYNYMNDWPAPWYGGIATWDVCGVQTFFSNYITRSDIRLKKDISNMDKSITTNFMKLHPVTYLLKKEIPETMGTQYGFIAQEVAELFPTIVTKDSGLEGATIGMNYQALIAPTIHVVQEQQKKIDLLESQLQELQKELILIKKNKN